MHALSKVLDALDVLNENKTLFRYHDRRAKIMCLWWRQGSGWHPRLVPRAHFSGMFVASDLHNIEFHVRIYRIAAWYGLVKCRVEERRDWNRPEGLPSAPERPRQIKKWSKSGVWWPLNADECLHSLPTITFFRWISYSARPLIRIQFKPEAGARSRSHLYWEQLDMPINRMCLNRIFFGLARENCLSKLSFAIWREAVSACRASGWALLPFCASWW